MFGAFVQVDGAYSRKFQGSGLGLNIVKRLADLMGGHLSIESEPGKGTAIHFCMPSRSADVALPDLRKAKPQAGSGRSLHLLIVEDERVNRLTLAKFVERLGHTHAEADNGRAALALLREQRFDAILMDVQMPILNGVETTRIIRSEEQYSQVRDIPIVALTAHAMAGDREEFLKAGMDDYLPKPISLEDLDALLKRLLDQ